MILWRTYGACTVGIYVNDDVQMYRNGILNSPSCKKSPEHAVTVIGYGITKKVPYWHILNSWGSDWGEKGTFKLIRGKNMCNVGDLISCPIIEVIDNSWSKCEFVVFLMNFLIIETIQSFNKLSMYFSKTNCFLFK